MATKTSTTIRKRKSLAPRRILAVDVGGTKLKILASDGHGSAKNAIRPGAHPPRYGGASKTTRKGMEI